MMIIRTALAAVLALGVLTAPLAVEAQQAGRTYRIGTLAAQRHEDSRPFMAAFEQGLRELGWAVGQNLVIEYRFAQGKDERLPALAAELVRLRVDLITVANETGAQAVRQASTTVPIVTTLAQDLMGTGLAASLARPGGQVTGLMVTVEPELAGKYLELLREAAAPGLVRVAVLWHRSNPSFPAQWQAMQSAARTLRLALLSVEAQGPEDLPRAFASMASWRANGLVALSGIFGFQQRGKIAELALKHRLPSLGGYRQYPEAGGFLSYGPDLHDNVRRSARYVDRILKGARPGDLPIERPVKFDLVVNLKTAKALGLTIPQSIRVRADEFIQ
jgi:putative ABC transport system substrate-binding protein